MQVHILRKLFVTFSIINILAACGPPIGYVGGSGITFLYDYDDFWAVPRRQVYNIGDDFVRTEDLWVFASSRGVVGRIDVDKVEIGLITNSDAATPNDPVIVDENEYTLATYLGSGRKLVVITYGEMKAEYSIELMDPHDLVDDGDGGGISIGW